MKKTTARLRRYVYPSAGECGNTVACPVSGKCSEKDYERLFIRDPEVKGT